MSLAANLQSAMTRVGTEIKSVRTQFSGNSTGDLSTLSTTNKSSLLAAINELDAAIASLGTGEGGATIDDEATATSTTWSSSKIAGDISTAVSNAITAIIGGAPDALNTLNELAAALGDDENFASAVTTSLAEKAPLASPALTGIPTTPTAGPATNTTQVASTAFVRSLTGDPETDFVSTFEAGL